ncbi:hypothetical protein FB567DRAFT_593358 [Paraphoma chrysanthemicola]|uniref:Uncharacterized protein n=1 Tax=Paraphoma chrysanthemicola TaxID=798071 RepID=A0A8K0R3N3_9PLEO|nr:hypothetical protein FB567DRAFT_593358 [Paraphoma chrysanthemicola]
MDSNPRSSAQQSARTSKIPTSRPSSQMTGTDGRRTPLTVSATGSPLPAVPVPPRNVTSPTPTSKIPKKSQVPFGPPTSKTSRISTGGGHSRHSGLPRPHGAPDTPIVTSPTGVAYKKTSPLSSRDKPLPSPPIAQVVDPNSPPKAQRTLVDAEAGTPSDEAWPILRPETFSPLKDMTSYRLPKPEQQQQRRSVSEVSSQSHNANMLVENRSFTASASFDVGGGSVSSRQSQQPPALLEERKPKTIEARRFSSNNPYGRAFHAYSPAGDEAVNSPLARKSSAPLTIQVPPRLSSKRASLPLLRTELHGESSQEEVHDIKQNIKQWPLHKLDSDDTPSSVQDHANRDEVIFSATNDAAPSGESVNSELAARSSDVSLADKNVSPQDHLEDQPLYDPETGYRTKILSWKKDEPTRGPVLRVHKDADALILGIGEVSDDEPDLSDEPSEKVSLRHSIGAFAHRMSKPNRSTTTAESKPLPTTASTMASTMAEADKIESVKISPLRNFAPQRQPSARLPPWSPSSRIVQNSNENRSPLSIVAPDVTASGSPQVEASSATNLGPRRPSSPAQMNQVKEATIATTADASPVDDEVVARDEVSRVSPMKKAKRVLGMGREGPPRWMAPTMSSLGMRKRLSVEHRKAGSPRKMSGRMSSRDVPVNADASGTTPPSSRRTAQSNQGTRRASHLRTSMIATPASERSAGTVSASKSTQTGPELLAQSSTSSAVDNNVGHQSARRAEDVPKKSSIAKVKAKRSFRSMFSKSDIVPTEKMPKVPDTKRASLATSSKTLTKRVSKSFSKTNVQTIPAGQYSTAANDTKMHDIAAPHQGTPSNFAAENQLAFQCDPAVVLTKLTNTVMSMSADHPQRERVLELAEAVLQIVETSDQAKLSCEHARKHARDAELNYARIQLDVGRIQKLCESLLV